MDYSKKRCVVCSQVGGIESKDDGLFVCKHCGTPYRPRASNAPVSHTTSTPAKAARPSARVDRLVWFEYEDNGQPRTGLYDCPPLPEGARPTLDVNRKYLRFIKYLVEKGHLTGDTHPVVSDHPEQ